VTPAHIVIPPYRSLCPHAAGHGATDCFEGRTVQLAGGEMPEVAAYIDNMSEWLHTRGGGITCRSNQPQHAKAPSHLAWAAKHRAVLLAPAIIGHFVDPEGLRDVGPPLALTQQHVGVPELPMISSGYNPFLGMTSLLPKTIFLSCHWTNFRGQSQMGEGRIRSRRAVLRTQARSATGLCTSEFRPHLKMW
jgi:hypothetical protein